MKVSWSESVYEEMKADPLEGDWCLFVQKYFEESNLQLSDDQLTQMDNKPYKILIKKMCVNHHSFISRKNKKTFRKEVYWSMKTLQNPNYILQQTN